MEYKGGDLMFSEVAFAVFAALLFFIGLLSGIGIEHERTMRRLREVAEAVNGKPCCGNCKEYNGTFCMKEWNNLDECYKVEWRDSKEPDEWCEDWEFDETWEE